MNSRLPFICLLIISLVSCSVKKRNYRDGYYVDWTFTKMKTEQKHSESRLEKKLIDLHSNLNVESINKVTTDDVTASNEKTAVGIAKPLNRGLILLNDTCGDIITLKSGDVVKAKVMEITEDKIKYKRCDNLNGPLFVVSKTTVHSIKYVNGVTEIIEPPAYSPNNNNDRSNNQPPYGDQQRMNHKAVLSLVWLILGFVPFLFGIPWIVSLILSINAINEINANPKIYKGLLLAKIVRTIDTIILGLIALILIIGILILASII